MLTEINMMLSERGLLLKQGTIVDATIIAAPSSTKNKSGKRDPEMHQTQKGNNWHFGIPRQVANQFNTQITNQVATLSAELKGTITEALAKAQRLMTQTKHRKSKGVPKLYSWHAPETECISKGKARTPYEFGVKVGITSTIKGNLILGARSFPNNPFDGHTLNEQLEQASMLSNSTIKNVYVDLGYRGVDQDNPRVSIKHRGKYKSLTEKERKLLKHSLI
jgi:IS5 family transposase